MPTPRPIFIDLFDWGEGRGGGGGGDDADDVGDGFDVEKREEELRVIDADVETLEVIDADVEREEEALEAIDTDSVAVPPMVVITDSPPGMKKVSVELSHLQPPPQQ